MEDISVLTLNVRSIRSDFKWIQLSSFLERQLPDVVLLQETNAFRSPLPFYNNKYSFHFNPPTQVCTGTMIGLRRSSPLVFNAHNILVPGYLQEVILNDPSNCRSLHFVCVYIPHNSEMATQILRKLDVHLSDIRRVTGNDVQFLLGGDFNFTLCPKVDRSGGGLERYPSVANRFKQIVDVNLLSDAWRDFYPTEQGFTFISNTPYFSGSRLDRMYLSPLLIARVTSVKVLPSFSDHFALLTQLSTNKRKTSAPYWRFDNALLEDDSFAKIMREVFEAFQSKRALYDSTCVWWEMLKEEIKSTCKRFVRFRRQTTNELFRRLEHRVERIISEPIIVKQNLSDLSRANEQVRDAYMRHSEQMLCRAQHEHLLAVDSPASIVMAQDVSASFKPLTKLRQNGTVVSDGSSLCQITRRHFLDVYTETPVDLQKESALYKTLPMLSKRECTLLDSPFSITEITTALKSLNKGKAPGIDGLTPEFYCFFWPELNSFFYDVFVTNALPNGKLPRTAQKSVLTLIPKSGDNLEIGNWRPISLLTTDYKIIARAAANRLKNVLSTLIHPDQGYCIPGRTIIDNLNLHRDMLEYANKCGLPMALLSLDQKGAFDRVDHTYLFHLLDIYGFGKTFIKMIKTLYNDATCFIRVGSHLTAPFKIGRGIRQGCPLSGQLFALTIEPFLQQCRTRMQGFVLPCKEERKLVVSAYADDVSVFISKNEDFDLLQDTYNMYAAQSGSELNTLKSTGLWSGTWINRKDEPIGFRWSSDGGKFLGVMLGNETAFTAKGFAKLEENLTLNIRHWRHRAAAMSLRGRVLVANQFLAPRLWYMFQVVPPPKELVNKLQGMLANFVWAGRRHWVRLRDLCIPVCLGGLGLIHIASKIELFRILFANRFILQLEDHPCHVMTRYFIGNIRGLGLSWQIFFVSNIGPSHIKKTTSFLATVFKAWSALAPSLENNFQTVCGLRDIPLVSSRLLATTSDIFISSWALLNCRTIGDLLNGCDWKDLDSIPGYHSATRRQKQALFINLKRIKAFCHLRFRDVRFMEGPEPWPITLNYKQFQDGTVALLDLSKNRRSVQSNILAKALDIQSPCKGHWSNCEINWSTIFRSPSLGLDSEITWRFNRNRLADPIFLHHAGLSLSRLCPWCHVEGTAWHMLIMCNKANRMWCLVAKLLHALFGPERKVLLRDIYVGFSLEKSVSREQANLANFLIVLAKSSIYRLITAFFKEETPPAEYEIVLAARIKCRIFKEYAWHLGRGDITTFHTKWCINRAICTVQDSKLTFAESVTSLL